MTQVTFTITATVGGPITSTVLADYFPAEWTLINPSGGTITDTTSGRKRIAWPAGDLKAGDRISSTYVLQSPTMTSPPSTYDFQSEVAYNGSLAAKGPIWSVVVDDPAIGPAGPYARAISGSAVAVAWLPAGEASTTGYKVFRGQSSAGPFSVITTTTTGQLVSSMVDTGLQASTEYFYLISAYSELGESSLAGPVSATTTPPDPPKGISAWGGSGSITINWIANGEPNVSGYNVYRSDTSGGSFGKVTSSTVSLLTYSDTEAGLNQTSYYYYRVTAVDSTGAESSPSPEVSAKPTYSFTTNGPHGGYSALTDVCSRCHRTHSAPGEQLLKSSSQKELCYSCHDGTGSQYNVTAEFTGTVTSSHPVATDVLKCSACHDVHVKPQVVPKLLDAGGKSSGNDVCYACHGAGSSLPGGDHQADFEAGYHKASVPVSPAGTQVQCSSCHKGHASTMRRLEIRKDESSCYSCHDGSTSGGNVFSKFTAITAPPNSSSPNARHDVSDADQSASGAKVECTNCHNPHTRTSPTRVVDPEAPSMANIWAGTTRAFCEKCHDGAYPSAAQTGPYAPEVKGPTSPLANIRSVYSANQHGDGSAGTASLDPGMGYVAGDSLKCEACHDAHGSPNPYHLKTSVTSKDGTKNKTGLVAMPVSGGGYDFRYFCNACHTATQMGNSQPSPTNCASCHSHSGNF